MCLYCRLFPSPGLKDLNHSELKQRTRDCFLWLASVKLLMIVFNPIPSVRISETTARVKCDFHFYLSHILLQYLKLCLLFTTLKAFLSFRWMCKSSWSEWLILDLTEICATYNLYGQNNPKESKELVSWRLMKQTGSIPPVTNRQINYRLHFNVFSPSCRNIDISQDTVSKVYDSITTTPL